MPILTDASTGKQYDTDSSDSLQAAQAQKLQYLQNKGLTPTLGNTDPSGAVKPPMPMMAQNSAINPMALDPNKVQQMQQGMQGMSDGGAIKGVTGGGSVMFGDTVIADHQRPALGYKHAPKFAQGGKVLGSSDEDIEAKAKKYGWSPEQIKQFQEMRDSRAPSTTESSSDGNYEMVPVDPGKLSSGVKKDFGDNYAQGGLVKGDNRIKEQALKKMIDYGDLKRTKK